MTFMGKYFTRSTSKPRLDVSTVILVEGPDDGFFLDEVLTSINAPQDQVGVCIAEGKDNLGGLLQAVLKAPTFTSKKIKRYAVIRDVDENLNTCLSECNRLFADANEPQPQPNSFAQRSDGRHNGLFLMPSGTEVGSLETLALRTLGENAILAAADSYLTTSKEYGGASDHLDKRRSQALLASLSDPLCNGVGWATRRGHFNVESDSLQELKKFLVELQTK